MCKEWKRTINPYTTNKNIQPGYRNVIWHWKIYPTHNEVWKKRKKIEGIKLPNQDNIRTLREKDSHKDFGILGTNNIKQSEMKKKKKEKKRRRKDYLRRTRKILKTEFCRRNLSKGINTRAVPLVRYSGPLLKWIRQELK